MWNYKQSMGLLYFISLVSMVFGLWLMYEGLTGSGIAYQVGLFATGIVIQILPLQFTMALVSGDDEDVILKNVWEGQA